MKVIRKLSIMLSLLLTFVILLPFAGCTKIPGENHMGILVSEEVQRENNLRLLSKGIDDPDRSAPIYGGQSYLFELQILPDNDPEALRSAKFTLAWDEEYDTPIEDCLMSRKGNCMDNGAMENFFGRLKVEMFYGEKVRDSG